MAKRKAVVRDTLGDDIVDRLRDLHKQATVERSHYRQVRERRHQRELRKALGIVEGVSNWRGLHEAAKRSAQPPL